MNIFVVTADPVTDGFSTLVDSGGVVAAFTTVEAANEYIENVEETYMRKRGDYSIDEVKLG